MAEKRALTKSEVLATIEREEKAAYGFYNGTLSSERQTALDYYLGEGFPDDDILPEGRSKVVSTDVADTIEWVLPQLLKVFLSGDEVVKFVPVSKDDIQAADQETAYVNHVVAQQNDAFATFYDWFKTALIQKMGYVKAWYEEKEDVTTESYKGLTEEEFQMMLQDDDLEPTEHEMRQEMEEVPTPQGIVMQPVVFHDVTLKRTEKCSNVIIEAVPPEEIFVSTSHRFVSLKDAPFVEHRTKKSISYIRELGYTITDDISDATDTTTEEENRDQYQEYSEDEQVNTATRLVWLRDIYLRIDANGDGIAELKRYLVVGKTILDEWDCDIIPFAALCPIPMPHRHVGLSYADLIMDLQEIKSELLRQVLDNGYLSNNGRFAISDRVNLADMLVSRPGGVVRVDGEPGTAIMPLIQPSTGQNGIQLLEYADAIKEARTGVTKYNQGLDANSLNKTATGIQQIMSMAQSRIELVARLFAEGGVKDLFSIVHQLLLTHEKAEKVFELRGEWIPVNPREWKKRTQMTISVGLGTGNKDQQLGHLSNLFNLAMPAAQMGVVQPQNVYEMLKAIAVNAGFKDADKFVTNPAMAPPQQPPQPDPLIQVEMIRQQGKQQEMQLNAQIEQQKAQANMQQEQVRSQNDVAIEQAKIQAQIELERWKAELDARTALEKARIDAETKLAIEQVKAANQAAPAQVSVNNDTNGQFAQMLQAMMEKSEANQQTMLQTLIETLSRPRQVVRGPDGKVVGVQ